MGRGRSSRRPGRGWEGEEARAAMGRGRSSHRTGRGWRGEGARSAMGRGGSRGRGNVVRMEEEPQKYNH